jgi:hypothetical protein
MKSSWNNEFTSSIIEGNDKTEIWKRLKLNCSYLILEFLMEDIGKCFHVCKSWDRDIKKILENQGASILTPFKNEFFKRISLLEWRVNFNDESKVVGRQRLDLLMKCQIQSKITRNRVVLSHEYRLLKKPKKIYYSNYTFDCLAADEHKCFWMYREETKVREV